MFCGECGTENPDTNSFCKNCGKTLKKPQQAAAPVVLVPVEPAAGPALPAPQAPGSLPVPPASQSAVKPPRNWLGIGSIVIGILAWLLVPYILGIIAVLLGAVSVYKLKKTQGKIAISGVIGIVIALAAMLVNYFYIFIF